MGVTGTKPSRPQAKKSAKLKSINKNTILHITKKVVWTVTFVITTIFVINSSNKNNQRKLLPQQPLHSNSKVLSEAIKESSFRQLSLEYIFDRSKKINSSSSSQNNLQIVVTGDVMLGRSVNVDFLKQKDTGHLFSNVINVLKNADITLVNLESPLIKNCPQTNQGMRFCGDQSHAVGLLNAGVDIASLANNHAYDFGTQGLAETKEALENNKIQAAGHEEVTTRTVKGTKLAVVGFDTVSHFLTDVMVMEKIGQAKINADIVIVFFHWGSEYTNSPNKKQRELAHVAIESGADLVVGNHPHWVQALEFYKQKLISYSHGNFVFDQMWSTPTREGIIGSYTFENQKLVDVELIPIFINNDYQPVIAEGEKADSIINQIKDSSNTLR